MKKIIMLILLTVVYCTAYAQIDYDAEIAKRQEQISKIESDIRTVEKDVIDSKEKIKQNEASIDKLTRQKKDLEAKIKEIQAQIEKLKNG